MIDLGSTNAIVWRKNRIFAKRDCITCDQAEIPHNMSEEYYEDEYEDYSDERYDDAYCEGYEDGLVEDMDYTEAYEDAEYDCIHDEDDELGYSRALSAVDESRTTRPIHRIGH